METIMNFSDALNLIKDGKLVKRVLWPGPSIIWMAKGSMDGNDLAKLATNDRLGTSPANSSSRRGIEHVHFEAGDTGTTTRLPVINFSEFATTMPGWVPSQEDLFADDWVEV
jgi:hypothetical protein